MKTILFVTAFKDIGRADWQFIPRSIETYVEQFMNLAKNIDYKLLVFVEEPMRQILLKKNLHSNIFLFDSSLVPTFYERYIENERQMIVSPEYIAKVSLDRRNCIEHTKAEYTLVNHSKINYISWAKKVFPNYEFYSWIDFGCIRNTIHDTPKYMNLSKLENKIIYLALKAPPDTPISAENMLKSHDVYLAGSQFIVHKSLVEVLENLWEKKLEEWKRDVICDEDQGLILQIYFENRDLFQLFHSPRWFSLYSNFLNTSFTPSQKNDLFSLLRLNDYHDKAIEIGVARGNFSSALLSNTNISKLYCIDPYCNFEQKEYNDGMNTYNMEVEFMECQKNLSKFGDRVEFVRKTSSEAVGQFQDHSIDFVYIDGNHHYKYALEDMENYWKKVKPGGILAGDDVYELATDGKKEVYKNWGYENSFGTYGVHNALVDFSQKYNVKYYIFGNQFYIFKV